MIDTAQREVGMEIAPKIKNETVNIQVYKIGTRLYAGMRDRHGLASGSFGQEYLYLRQELRCYNLEPLKIHCKLHGLDLIIHATAQHLLENVQTYGGENE